MIEKQNIDLEMKRIFLLDAFRLDVNLFYVCQCLLQSRPKKSTFAVPTLWKRCKRKSFRIIAANWWIGFGREVICFPPTG